MTINTSVKSLTAAMVTTLLLSACGGGSGSDSGSSSTSSDDNTTSSAPPQTITPPSISKPAPNTPDEPPSIEPPTAKPTVAQDKISSIKNSNHANAALAGSNLISLERQSCGLSGLQYDEALAAISQKHAQYNQHMFSSARLIGMNEHHEDALKGYEHMTGSNNPFFTGRTFKDRLEAAPYFSQSYGATENIARKTYFSSNQMIDDPSTSSIQMARSLLAAPYHLKQLTNPAMNKTGAALVAYTPYGKNPDTNKGYIFVNTSASTKSVSNKAPKGIFTYPCAGTSGTVTALYHESPNPVKGTGRNLRVSPIGQPIYVSMPSAQRIKVSNIKIYDAARKITVPTELLDSDNDPYKGTNYKIPTNEAFILPTPDNFKSCKKGSTREGKDCGLHGNTSYQVSFDVLVDNKDSISKSFTFMTGEVNY